MRLIRDREKVGEGGVWRGGEEGDEVTYLLLHCHHKNDFCGIKVGSDESHFNVSQLWGTKSQDSVHTETTTFEQEGEPKRIRTEVLPLTSLTPYR